jgi:hypothetical protein
MNPLETPHLKKVAQPDPTSKGSELPLKTRGALACALSPDERIEKNKDKLDLKPNIDFVSRHIDLYEKAVGSISKREPSPSSLDWASKIEFVGDQDIVDPQLSSEDCRQLLSRMPEPLIQLSKLQTISYLKVIPVPGYDDQGNFDDKKVKSVPAKDFPRPNDHPTRILVGISDGKAIYPSPIPKTVSTDERATYLYQAHVLLHEFFHTIDYPRRDPKERSKILLEMDGNCFSYQDWWNAFEKLILKGIEPVCVSSYANTYTDHLTSETKAKDFEKFTDALAEQICETFVAYQLNIISNDDEWTDFRSESFGNQKQQEAFKKGEAPSANLKWVLMDKLCRAKVVQ